MPVKGIEHRAVKVSLVTALSTGLTLAFQLISVPICLKYWGKQPYGTWLAISSAFTLIRSLDTGFVMYVGNKLNYLFHQSMDELRRHLSSAVFGIIVISLAEILIATSTSFSVHLSRLLGMPDVHGDTSPPLALMIITVSWVLTGSYIGIVHRLQIPAGMMYQAAWWGMGFQVTQFVAMILASVFSLQMWGASLLFAGSQVFIYLASGIYLRRKLPSFLPWLRGASVSLGLRDLRESFALTGSNILQQSATSGMVVLVAALAGPVAVPVFTTVRTVANLWAQVSAVLAGRLLPDVVRYHVNAEVEKLVALNEAFWVVCGSLVTFGALLAYPVIPNLYRHWTGHAVVLNKALLCLLLASVVVTNSVGLMTVYLNGINSLRIVASTSVARALLALGGGAAAYRTFGVAGFGLGILAGELVAAVLTARRFFNSKIAGRDIPVTLKIFAPAFLSTGSVVLFFLGSAFDWWAHLWIACWIATLIIVVVAAAWGWIRLDMALRNRLIRFLGLRPYPNA